MSLKKTIKVWLVNLTKKNVVLRVLVRLAFYIKRRFFFVLRGIGRKTQDKTVMFYSFKGKSYSCTPKAVYEYMLSHDEYKDYKFIWAFTEPDNYEFLKENPNTEVIKYHGKIFERRLAVAKYWIFNYRVDDHIYPKKNQVYVQCWHGTPLKKLGYDLHNSNNAMNSDKEIYAKYKIDASKFKYILSPSKFASEKFASAWNLNETGMTDKILELGYPRNDILYNYSKAHEEEIKEKLGVPKDKKILMYAPTWRDDNHQAGVGYIYETQVDFDLLQEKLSDEYVILFRAHYLVANSFDFEKYEGFIYDVSNVDDINELYVISDVLITDYSSVFFDYANLKRPIIFYMYDFDKYKNDLRGFYIDIAELPGDIVKNEADLLRSIEKTKNFEYDERYKRFNEKFNYLDDGNAAERLTKAVIK